MKKVAICIMMIFIMHKGHSQSQWNQVWSDEFNYTGVPDQTKWTFDPGPNPYNNEMQYYTENAANTRVENGNLVMEVKKETLLGKNYTSSRINTKVKANWTHGKMEARMLLTKGDKLWPAFWMMPETDTYGTWPASGEIDIMEYWSWDKAATFGNYHCSNFFAQYGKRNAVTDPSTNWHIYAVEWDSTEIKWSCDGVQYASYKNPNTGTGAWPFDKPFYIIFNIAVEEGAAPAESTWQKKTVEVDYVRVYKAGAAIPVSSVALNNNSITVPKYGTQQLTATISPSNASNTSITWTSSNTNVATVSASGLVNGINNGTATITATTNNAIKATCAVNVSGVAACNLLSLYQVPRSSGLPTLTKTYTNAHVLGTGGPNLTNVTSFQVTWNLVNKNLNSFALNTNNGTPSWWYDLKPFTTQNLGVANAACTIAGSSIGNLNGSYYVNVDGDNLVLVAQSGGYAVYLSNSSVAPAGCSSSTPDTVSPSVPTTLAAVPTTNSINLTWQASTDNVAVTGYKIYQGTVLLTTVTVTNYTVTGLSASTAYTFKVSAIDAAGNESVKASVNTTSAPTADTTAPSIPTALNAIPTTNNVNLTWQASTDNIVVTGYKIYQGTALLATVTGTNYTVTGLSASTAYKFKVSAIDAAGNESAKSTVNTNTTSVLTAFNQKIEAENYANSYGVFTESCSEGELNVGWIDNGDWIAYAIDIPATGTYTIELRVASASNQGTVKIENYGGTPLYGALDIPSTGNWQSWTTISTTINLNAGSQTLALAAVVGGWNINWIRIKNTTTAKVATNQASKELLNKNTKELSDEISIYPTITETILNIENLSNYREKFYIIFDSNGKSVKSGQIDSGVNHYSIDVQRFTSGVYLLKLEVDGKTKITRFIKK